MPRVLTPEHIAYKNMLARCYNCRNPQYHDYGGRGISVCDRWIGGHAEADGYKCFMQDMGERPSNKHSLDRIDNDLDYGPSNCHWVTRKEQQRNRRSTIWVVYRGKEMSLADAADLAGVGVYSRLAAARFHNGWSVEKIVETPPKNMKG